MVTKEQFESLLPGYEEVSGSPPAHPKVSVRMITFNHAEFIAQAIESVLIQQTNFEFELVIGEDFSTDGTREIVLEYQRKHPDRIRVLLANENGSKYTGNGRLNFFRALRACRGQYIAFLDGDDYWVAPNKLQAQVDFLDAHPEYAECCHGAVMIGHPNGEILGAYKRPFPSNEFGAQALLEHENFIPTSSTMIRGDVARKLPADLYWLPVADWPMHVCDSIHGPIGWIDENMGMHRVHSQGIWTKQNQTRKREWTLQTFEFFKERLYPAHQEFIDKRISELSFQLAADYCKKGNPTEARSHLRRCLAANPRHSEVPARELLKLMLRVYIPVIHACARQLKRLIGK